MFAKSTDNGKNTIKKETKAILATLKEKGRRDSILGGRYNEWMQ